MLDALGFAQSVVAYAFIQRDVDERYTPVQWTGPDQQVCQGGTGSCDSRLTGD